jgi:hypothetical protein
MITLIQTNARELRNLLPDGLDASLWHGPLTAEIAAHLSPAHATILSRPIAAGDSVRWEADANRVAPYRDLPAADQAALMRAVRGILSDVRRLAERGSAPVVRQCWPTLREIPDLAMLFVADGRPVLAAWGSVSGRVPAAAGILAEAYDQRPWQARPETRWMAYGTAATLLATGALIAGLALSRLLFPGPVTSVCVVAPADMAALAAQAQQDRLHATLQGELARLVQEHGRRALQCPLAAAAADAPALPAEQWQRHDLAMFEGCWNSISEMQVSDDATGQALPVASWRLCFDRSGQGNQTVTLQNGGRCVGPVTAVFVGDRLVTTAERCMGPGFGGDLGRTQENCTRLSDTEARCVGQNLEGPRAGHTKIESLFRR